MERRHGSREEYTPLTSMSDAQIPAEDYELIEPRKPRRWPIVLSTISFALSLCTFMVTLFYLNTDKIARNEPTLETVSSYIGLEKSLRLGKWTQPFPDILNFPLLVAHVDRNRPSEVLPDDTPHWWTFQGTVIPDKRRILITNSISTVMQLRVLDFAMENCQISFIVPTSFNTSMNTTVLAPSIIDVWSLSTDRALEVRTLTWSNRPKRLRRLGSLDLSASKNATSDAFSCDSGSYQTFELSCATADCQLDFWQYKEEPSPVFYLIQKQFSE